MLFVILNFVFFCYGVGLIIAGTATWITILATIINAIAFVLNYGRLE